MQRARPVGRYTLRKTPGWSGAHRRAAEPGKRPKNHRSLSGASPASGRTSFGSVGGRRTMLAAARGGKVRARKRAERNLHGNYSTSKYSYKVADHFKREYRRRGGGPMLLQRGGALPEAWIPLTIHPDYKVGKQPCCSKSWKNKGPAWRW